jgi:hypothetical protein
MIIHSPDPDFCAFLDLIENAPNLRILAFEALSYGVFPLDVITCAARFRFLECLELRWEHRTYFKPPSNAQAAMTVAAEALRKSHALGPKVATLVKVTAGKFQGIMEGQIHERQEMLVVD